MERKLGGGARDHGDRRREKNMRRRGKRRTVSGEKGEEENEDLIVEIKATRKWRVRRNSEVNKRERERRRKIKIGPRDLII